VHEQGDVARGEALEQRRHAPQSLRPDERVGRQAEPGGACVEQRLRLAGRERLDAEWRRRATITRPKPSARAWSARANGSWEERSNGDGGSPSGSRVQPRSS
jgi:hypothetical protein